MDLLFSVTGHPVISDSALSTLAALIDLVLVPRVLHQRFLVRELRVALRARRHSGPGNFDQDRIGRRAVGGKSLVSDVI